MLESLYVPAAVSCCVAPTATVGLFGLIDNEFRVAVTFAVVEVEAVPYPAPMPAFVPTATAVANPLLLIETRDGEKALHTADFVTSRELLSWNVAVAVNCSVWPTTIDGNVGDMVSDFNVVLVTASVVDPATPPELAVTVVVPVVSALPTPEALIEATPGADEVHVTEARTFVLLSLNVPVATNCCTKPTGREGLAGVTEIDVSVGLDTVSVADPVTAPAVADRVALPAATVVAIPEASTVATPVAFDAQVTAARL